MRRMLGMIFTLFTIGCTTTPADLRQSDASVRIPSIEKSVHQKNVASEKQMVRDLRSDDPAIRFYAIQGLYRLTGTTLGYRYYDDELERMQGVLRWEKWLRDRQGKNSKSEVRNSKQIQNSNNAMIKTQGCLCLEFGPSDFRFVSDFGFRMSNFANVPHLDPRPDYRARG